LTETFKVFGGDSDATWAERQRIHAEALNMCNTERDNFGTSISKISEMASAYSTRGTIPTFKDFPLD